MIAKAFDRRGAGAPKRRRRSRSGARVDPVGGRGLGAGPFHRVLVMDDDLLVRRTVERLLEALGCPAVTAAEGGEAVTPFAQAREQGRPFDLLLLDLTVPGGSGGVETLAAIRQVAPDVRAVVMSGYADNPVMARHRDFGFQAVLPKPFTFDRLADAMRDVASADI